MKRYIISVIAMLAVTMSSAFAEYDMTGGESNTVETGSGYQDVQTLNQTEDMQTPDTMPQTINPSFDSKEDFEKAQGYICETATDGTNTYMMKDGMVAGGTKIAAPEGTQEVWMCQKYIDGVYAMSDSDRSGYNTMLARTNDEQKEIVDRAYDAFHDIVFRYRTTAIQNNLKHTFLGMIEAEIVKITMANPADAALGEDDQYRYEMLSLLKYKVMALQIEDPKPAVTNPPATVVEPNPDQNIEPSEPTNPDNQVNETGVKYSCDDASYTLYFDDYFVGDMGFHVGEGEVHIADADHTTPNYRGTQVEAGSGAKYKVEDANLGTTMYVWIKGDDMTVMDENDNVLHTCSVEK